MGRRRPWPAIATPPALAAVAIMQCRLNSGVTSTECRRRAPLLVSARTLPKQHHRRQHPGFSRRRPWPAIATPPALAAVAITQCRLNSGVTSTECRRPAPLLVSARTLPKQHHRRQHPGFSRRRPWPAIATPPALAAVAIMQCRLNSGVTSTERRRRAPQVDSARTLPGPRPRPRTGEAHHGEAHHGEALHDPSEMTGRT